MSSAARSAELEQLARESIQNAEHLTERKNYSGAIKEYQRAAELRKQTAASKRDTASTIADVIGALMVERDHYRDALERIALGDVPDEGSGGSRKALREFASATLEAAP